MSLNSNTIGIILSFFLFTTITLNAQARILDSFETTNGWEIFKSDGVELKISNAEGFKGKALKFEYNFTTGAGYCGIQKQIPLDLSGNFRFSYFLRAESPSNNLEFKLLDAGGESVWWNNKRNYEFPKTWQKNNIKRRNIEFAWGPVQDKTLRKIDRLEFTVASFVGGKGTLYIDELTWEELPLVPDLTIKPEIKVTSNQSEANNIFDGSAQTFWRPADLKPVEILFDFKQLREYGAVTVQWGENSPEKIEISISDDGKDFVPVASVKDILFSKSSFYLPETESRFVKLKITQAFERPVSIREISFPGAEYSLTKNSFIGNVAKDNPRGLFPRYFYDEKSYWTIIGVDSDEKEAMINEDGMIEVDKQSFSLEPFLEYDGTLFSWANSENEQGLLDKFLPVPFVKRKTGRTELTVQSFADGKANENSVLFVKYEVKNTSDKILNGRFHIALRPYQVNPPYQFLNLSGGSSKVNKIEKTQSGLTVGSKAVYPFFKDYTLSLSQFTQGEILLQLSQGKLIPRNEITDPVELASGLLTTRITLAPGESKVFVIAVPFYAEMSETDRKNFTSDPVNEYGNKLESVAEGWRSKLNRVKFDVPSELQDIVNTVRSNIGYILINKDRNGIQPGSRSYERSWIRDGSLTSSAMMKMGYTDEIKEYIRWYASHQFPNGKVPCVVDKRGPDPVPEHDSHGEFIFLVKNYFNFTKDTLFLKEMYPNVKRAVDYMNSLIAERSTDHFRFGNDSVRAYYGILTESISHEGYSDKPRHSYWDNFFAMKGFDDAVSIAQIAGKKEDLPYLTNTRDKFEKDLYNSIDLAVKTRKINYLPGCVELGDFDATSTTIALYPAGQQEKLPKVLLKNTFEKYWDFFESRKNGKLSWINYTPYENRLIGSYILLGEADRAYALINYFMSNRRPKGWNHWAEVVWSDPRLPRFIGDMPHTWCGSDFINSARMLFAYENEYKSQLVLCAGIKPEMLEKNNLQIENLPTHYGDISYSLIRKEGKLKIKLWGNSFAIPSGGIKIAFTADALAEKTLISDDKVKYENGGLLLNHFPAEFEVDIK